MSVCLSVCLSAYLLPVQRSVHLSFILPIHPSVHPPIHPPLHQSTHPSTHTPPRLHHLSVHLPSSINKFIVSHVGYVTTTSNMPRVPCARASSPQTGIPAVWSSIAMPCQRPFHPFLFQAKACTNTSVTRTHGPKEAPKTGLQSFSSTPQF